MVKKSKGALFAIAKRLTGTAQIAATSLLIARCERDCHMAWHQPQNNRTRVAWETSNSS